MSPVAELLRQARALYAAAPSHAAPGYMPALGTYCVITAITIAALNDPARGQDATFAEDALVRAASGGDIIAWNANATTDEVLAAFDRAIEATS
jgi:hypothetical protein